ncbi:MAG TPA: ligase-associated DNA damage response exonuclease [Gemmatimonadaceae bacterium]|jgi:putative mRNA 3-end processing factor|nr:ligase-associated DNA damage response exonuclease [Gemmatimonadaceae bacterium]
MTLLRLDERGLYCSAGDFYVDPWEPVTRAVITHAHGDHARWGSASYLCSAESHGVLRTRLGPDASIQSSAWGAAIDMRGVRVSLHPAGHILGSAQIRIEYAGEVWVVSGDYKTDPDPTCTPYELVRCHTFITESTFGLPIYRWCPEGQVFDDIRAWWLGNARARRASVLFAYALGKAQRLLAGLADADIGPIYTHGAVERLNGDYRAAGVRLASTRYAGDLPRGHDFSGSLIIAPPSASGSTWLRRFGEISTGFASGWMRLRGARRRRAVDRGFVLSDHVDWPSLLAAVDGTGAERVWVTHGTREPLVRLLSERGIESRAVSSLWKGEQDLESLDIAGEEVPA